MRKMKNIRHIWSRFAGAALGVLLMLSAVLPTAALSVAYTSETDEAFKTPAQINVAVTETYDEMTVVFTTVDTEMRDAKVVINEVGSPVKTAFYAEKTEIRSVVDSNMRDSSNVKVSKKAYYTVRLTGLSANTHYEYTCSVRDDERTYRSALHDFWTPMESGSGERFSFIYTSDPQSCSIDGKAATTTSEIAKAIAPDAKFMYIAGDLIDGSVSSEYFSEGQYETLFNQLGNSNYNANFTNRYADYALIAVRGNHDDWEFNGHITLPSTIVPQANGENYEYMLMYSVSWGNLRLIVINTENRSSNNYKDQMDFIRSEVESAHASGQYAALCMHRSMYTGADHIASSDSVERRKKLASFLAEDVNIDFVLQGHDHCLARGQVDGNGENCGDSQKLADRIWYDAMPSNGPLYFVGGCSSSYKTYDAISFTPDANDPCAENLSFLDLNNAEPAGTDRNPGPCEGTDGQVSFTKVTVDPEFVRFDTYMYGYDAEHDAITYAPYLYDSYTVVKNTGSYADTYRSIGVRVDGDTTTQALVAEKAPVGDHVFVSANPGEGRQLAGVTVTCNGEEIEVEANRFGYSFVMPDGDVSVVVHTAVDSELELPNDLTELVSGGDWYGAAVTDTLPANAFTSDMTGFSQTVSANAAVFKKTVTLTASDIENLAGIAGTHTVNGGLTLYVNGVEVYRFNTGGYGSTSVGDPTLANDGYACAALPRTFRVEGEFDNLPTEYSSDGIPLFAAGSLEVLKSALKVGENVITCVVVRNDAGDLSFDLEADLLTFSEEMRALWSDVTARLGKILSVYTEDMYTQGRYEEVKALVAGASSSVEAHAVRSPAAGDRLVAQTLEQVASVPSAVTAAEELIEAVNDVITEQNADKVAAALASYNALTDAQKALVCNYPTLASAEYVWGGLVKGLTIISGPDQTKFLVGDTVNLDGLRVGVEKNNGEVTEVRLADCRIDTLDTTVAGTHTLTVEYDGMTVPLQIKIANDVGSTFPAWGIVLIVAAGVLALAGLAVVIAILAKRREKKNTLRK